MTTKDLLWKEIYNSIKREIVLNKYKINKKLDSENVYAKQFNVNRHTIRRAFKELKDDNLIYSKRGLGVFVKSSKINYSISKNVRFTENILQENQSVRIEIKSFDIAECNPFEKKELNLKKNDKVTRINSIGFVNNSPSVITYRSIPYKKFPKFINYFVKKQSVTKAFNLLNIKLIKRSKTLINAEIADKIKSNLLNINEGEALLKTTSVNVDFKNNPIELSESYFIGSKIQFLIKN